MSVRDNMAFGLKNIKLPTTEPRDTKAIAAVAEHLEERTLVYAHLSDGTSITAQDSGRSQVKPGDAVNLTFDTSQLHLFDESGKAWHTH